MWAFGDQVRRAGAQAARQAALILLAVVGLGWLSAAAVTALAAHIGLSGAMAAVGIALIAPLGVAALWRLASHGPTSTDTPAPEPQAFAAAGPLGAQISALMSRHVARFPLLCTLMALGLGVLAARAPALAATLATTLAQVLEAWERGRAETPEERPAGH